MSTNKKVLLASIIVGFCVAIYILTRPVCLGGFECLGFIAYIFFGIIVVPVVFGIAGFIFTSTGTPLGKRFLQSIYWLGISLAVMLVFTISASWIMAYRNNSERARLYPSTQTPYILEQ